MSATATGMAETRAAIDKLPETVTAALKQTAKASADRVASTAATILRSKTHGTGKTAASIRVLDESAEKQYTVNVPGDSSRPAGLAGWLEYGTRFMSARPFLRPAGDAENERYKANMAVAAEQAVKDALE